MRIIRRIPSDPSADSFTRKDVVKDIDSPLPPEAMKGRFYNYQSQPHSQVWPKRREEALKRFANNVKRFVEPMGFVEAFGSEAPHATREVELRWLIETQDKEIAPEYSRLAANGLEAFSMYTSYTDENGEEHEIADDLFADTEGEEDENGLPADYPTAAAEDLWTTAIAQRVDARQEEFLREADRRRWYSDRPKVAYMVVDADKRRGLVPKQNHPWTHEQLVEAMKRLDPPEVIARAMAFRANPKLKAQRAKEGPSILQTPREHAQQFAFQRTLAWLNELDADPLRDFFLEEESASKEQLEYAPNEECPGCIDGTEMTEDGDIEPCSVCRGDQKVAHTLGFDGLPAVDDERMTW